MKLPIKTKRDWCIAFIVTFVAMYYITMLFNWKIEMFMMKFAPVKLNIMNYPGGWGNLMIVGVIMTILTILLMVLQRKSWKYTVFAATVGIVISAGLFVGFLVHTNLIVGTSKKLQAVSIRISNYDNINISLDGKNSLDKEFAEAAVGLKEKSRIEQNKLKYDKDNEKDEETRYHVWISYPEKYGQSYDLILYVEGDTIYSNHGDGTPESRVFFENNGLIELLEKLLAENKSLQVN
jgi:hypothetical protein